MKYYPIVWILWGNDGDPDYKKGVHLEEVFAHKIDAEEYMSKCEEDDHGIHYWIQEKKIKS